MLVELLHPVAQMERDDQEPYKYYPRPSMAGPDRCERQMVYMAQGKEPEREIEGRVLHIFNDGHWHEELTVEWIQKTAFQLSSQQMKVSVEMLGLKIGGSIDGIVTDLFGVDRLFEHKGLNHFTFEKYWKNDEFPEDYLCQCAIYIRGLQADNPDLRQALLVIKNKNTCAFLEYLLDYDRGTDTLTVVQKTNHLGETIPIHSQDKPVQREGIVRRAFHKFLDVDRHRELGTLPDRPFSPEDWHCEYCQYKQGCWASYKEEIDSLADQVELEPEVADMLRYYKEVSAHVGEGEKEKARLRGEIVSLLKSRKAKQGRAGEYLASLNVVQVNRINFKKMLATTQAQVEACKEPSYQERLTIRKLEAV